MGADKPSSRLARWLKARRAELKLSQEELAVQLQNNGVDVSRSMVAHWENGVYHLPMSDPNAMREIAAVYGTTVHDLLSESGHELGDARVVWHRLRDRRLQMGLTQEELARRCNTDQRRISTYERFSCHISSAKLATLARALETSADYLLGLDIASSARDLTDDERKLLQAFRDKRWAEIIVLVGRAIYIE